MLAANEAVAEMLRDRGFHFLRRVHQPPTRRSSRPCPTSSPNWAYKTDSLESRFELQKLLERRGRPARASMRSILPCCARCSGPSTAPRKKAITPWPASATAISLRPSAAIPDLTVHRLIDAILPARKPRNDYERIARPRRALLRPRAAGRSGRTGADQTETAGLPEQPHRRGDGGRDHRRGEFLDFRPGDPAARPKGWSTSTRSATTITASTAPRTRLPGIAPATASGWGTRCAWRSSAWTWTAASSTSA